MQRQYSIALDLLLSSVSASVKGKYDKAAKLFDAALRAPDLAKTLSSLDSEQAQALIDLKAKKAEKAGTKPEEVKKEETATAGQRMAGFLKNLHATREAAKAAPSKADDKKAKDVKATAAAPAPKDKTAAPAKKPVKADAQDDEFDKVIDNMTQANTIDQILDPKLDMKDDGCDDGGGDATAPIPRPAPEVKADADPSPGNGESSLDTDQDDLMDLDLDDLTDLSDDDFGETAASDEDEDEDEEDDKEDKDAEEAASDDKEDDKDDKSDDKGDGKKAPPFVKKDDDSKSDDKKDDGDKKAPPFVKKDDDKEESKSKPAKAAFTRTISNLTALDRLSALTASMVDGTIKQKAKNVASSKKKPVDKAAKTASKK